MNVVGRARESLLVSARALLLTALSAGVSLLLLVLTLVAVSLIPIGIGLLAVPPLVEATRFQAGLRRLHAAEWSGVTIPADHGPPAGTRAHGFAGYVERAVQQLRDPATWRDVLWLLGDSVGGFLTAVLPWGLLAEGVHGLLLATGLWQPLAGSGTHWYLFVPVQSWPTALLAAGTGGLLVLFSLRFNPVLLRGHFLLTRYLLTHTTMASALAERVERLQETRHEVLDTSAAELRRIERDLHDGAQARLVAMGMSLGAIEALIESDPAQAKKLLAQARENSAEALTELRDLVRGIHPPVLAERGLGDAARALALRMELPVEVSVDLPGRLEEPVESAAYFAVSEVLTNVAKHAGAERAWLDIYYSGQERTLRVSVSDNGRGGADPAGGGGLRGLERRLGAFDGVLAVNSPAGGPTQVTFEIPCSPSFPAPPSSPATAR